MTAPESAVNTTSAAPAGRVEPVAHARMANAIRALAMDAVEAAKSGHPGMPMGMADVATVLFTRFLKFDPGDARWPDRDRFVLSAGHGSMLLYALLYLTGYEDVSLDDLRKFRQLGGAAAGHPEYGAMAGIETTTGPLGQGLANAVGMALAERLMAARFGDGLVDHATYAMVGDGCLMEGISQEAITLAGHLRLGKLIVLFDDNRVSIDGPTSLATSEDQLARFGAAGWDVAGIDGHDPGAIAAGIAAARASELPSLIACRTTIGFGAPKKAGTAASHGAPLGAEEVAGARAALDWPHAPFDVPEDILAAWRQAGGRSGAEHASWRGRLAESGTTARASFERVVAGDLPEGWEAALDTVKRRAIEKPAAAATRKSSGEVLAALAPVLPELVGGAADLTGSVNTKIAGQAVITSDDFAGAYIHYGVREHAMAAVMNGLALHGGVIPYAGTFLIFADYARPALRLSALMGLRVIYVMTHDSIGLGEDGPTHQPVEHLASLRAIPNLNVFRPADAVETVECWALALAEPSAPSVLVLTRQSVPPARTDDAAENRCAQGAYVLKAASKTAKAVLLATGSEVQLALAARETLEADGIATSVVSMPCWELFERQPEKYRREILGTDVVRVAVEAAVPFGWERYTGPSGDFVGMRGFGASAPADDLYRHFKITAGAIVAAVKAKIS